MTVTDVGTEALVPEFISPFFAETTLAEKAKIITAINDIAMIASVLSFINVN